MMKYNKYTMFVILAVVLIGLLTGCAQDPDSSSKDDAANKQTEAHEETTPPVNTDPVNLKIMYVNTLVAKEDIEQFISNPVKQKYPYITIEHMDPVSLPELLASGRVDDIPDIVITDYSNLSTVIDLQYPEDLNDRLKEQNVDLSKMETSPLNGIRALGAKGELFGLPLYLDKYMLFYNKDIFEQFAVPYPTDDMTYEDLVSLVKVMTRKEGDVQYLGYRWVNLYTFGYQLGVPVINATTGKADLQTESWKYVLSLVKEMIDVGNDTSVTTDHFFKEERLSMYPQWIGAAYGLLKSAETLNWDMAAMPYSKDLPKVSGPTKPIYLIASSVSKHKEQAVAAIAHVATSPEVQTLLSQHGRISALADEAIQKQFGTKMDLLAGKNVNAVFAHPFGEIPNTTAYESQAWPGLNTAPVSVMQGTDVNTALRMAEEAANKAIEDYLSNR